MMTRKKVEQPSHRSYAGLANDIVGPFEIRGPGWLSDEYFIPEEMKCDDENRVYVVGSKYNKGGRFLGPYLVRLTAQMVVEAGLADLDPQFGDAGFAAINPSQGMLSPSRPQIAVIDAAHVTISFIASEAGSVVEQVILCRFLTNGELDITFGVHGIAKFPLLPDPSPVTDAVVLLPGLPGYSTELSHAVNHLLKAMDNKVTEGAGEAKPVGGSALADGQFFWVAYKLKPFSGKFSYLIKVNENGTLDPAFADGVGYVRLSFAGSDKLSDYRISVDSRKRVVVVSQNTDRTRCFAGRFLANGYIDSSFGGSGFIQFSSATGAVDIPSLTSDVDDKTLLSVRHVHSVSNTSSVYLYRLEEDGSPDPAFNNGNAIELRPEPPKYGYQVHHIYVDDQHRVLLRGLYTDDQSPQRKGVSIARCNAQGLDPDFGEAGDLSVPGFGGWQGLAIQPGLSLVTSDQAQLWRIML